jgi:hypothetical protein
MAPQILVAAAERVLQADHKQVVALAVQALQSFVMQQIH